MKNQIVTGKKYGQISLALIAGYIVSLSLLSGLNLPLVGHKIQLPDLFFVLLLGWSAINFTHLPTLKNWLKYPAAIGISAFIFYLSAVTLSCVFSEYSAAYLELIGSIYLFSMTVIVAFVLHQLCENISQFIFRCFTVLGVFSAITGIVGWVLAQNGVVTALVRSESTYYPYIGFISRAQGFTITPNMFFSILAICMILLLAKMLYSKSSKLDYFYFLLLLIAGILTFSKSLMILMVGVLFLIEKKWFVQNGRVKILLRLTSIALVVFVWTGTHFLLIPQKEQKIHEGMEFYVDKSAPLISFENAAIYPSLYGYWKKSAVYVGCQNAPFGVGMGQFIQTLPQLKKNGIYPVNMGVGDSHSTYFGSFAELGIVGFLSVLWLFFSIRKGIDRLLKLEESPHYSLILGLAACFLIIAVEAMIMDIMNFRHYWILLAILLAIPNTENQTPNANTRQIKP